VVSSGARRVAGFAARCDARNSDHMACSLLSAMPARHCTLGHAKA
jgi:hypothetical protein